MNTWPYWREFVQSGAARMNWPAITLPLPLRKRSSVPAGRAARALPQAEAPRPEKGKRMAKAG